MTSPRPAGRYMTPEEYLAFEERSPVRHEYVGGVVHAMSGGSVRHARIIGNVLSRLREASAGGRCEAFAQVLKVSVDEETFYYPDVLVTCGALDEEAVVVTDPCLLVEVLSPSTRVVDRREKVSNYRRIAALRAYLIVETRYRKVERYWRGAGGGWQYDVATPDAGGQVAVPCPKGVLTLDQIYEGVTYRPRLRRIKEPAPAYAVTPGGKS